MAIYKYGTVTFGTTAQQQLALGFIPSVFRMKNITNSVAAANPSGLSEIYWDQALGALTTPYTLGAQFNAGAPTYLRIASGTVTTATGVVPYSTADNLLFVPNSATASLVAPYQAAFSTNLTITAISKAANAVITATHAFQNSDIGVTAVTFHNIVGMTQMNTLTGIVTGFATTTTFSVNINSSNFSTYVSGGIANVITGAPTNTVYGNQSLPTSQANLGTTGLIIGTSILGGATVATTDVWSYEAILQSPATGP